MAKLIYQLLFAAFLVSIASGAPTVEEVSETSVTDVQQIIDSAKPEDNDLAAPITEISAAAETLESSNVDKFEVKEKESTSAAPETVTKEDVPEEKKEDNSVPLVVDSQKEVQEPIKKNETSDSKISPAVVSNVELSVTSKKEEPIANIDYTVKSVDPVSDYIDYDYSTGEIVPEAAFRPEQFPYGDFIPPLYQPEYEYPDIDYPSPADFMSEGPQNDFYPEETAGLQDTLDVIPPETYVEDPSVIPPPEDFSFGSIIAGAVETAQNGPAYGIFANYPTPAPPIAEFPEDEIMLSNAPTVDSPFIAENAVPSEDELMREINEDLTLEDPLPIDEVSSMTEEELVNAELDAIASQNNEPDSSVFFMPEAVAELHHSFGSEPLMDDMMDPIQHDERPDSVFAIVAGLSENTPPEPMLEIDQTIDEEMSETPIEEPKNTPPEPMLEIDQTIDEDMSGAPVEEPMPNRLIRILSAIVGIPNRIRGNDEPQGPFPEPSSFDFLPFKDHINEPPVMEDQFPIDNNVFSNDQGPTEPSFFERPTSDVTINLDFDNKMAYVNGEPHSIRRPSSLIVLIDDIIQAAEQRQASNNFHDKGLYNDYSDTFETPSEPSYFDGFPYRTNIPSPSIFNRPPFFRPPQRMRFNPLKSFINRMRGGLGPRKVNRMRSMNAYRFGGPDMPPFPFNPYF